MMLQYLASFTGWFMFFLFIEQLGEVALAASNAARSIYMIALLPLWGFASASSSLVSYKIGRNEKDEVLSVVGKIGLLAFCSSLLIVSLLLIFQQSIVGFYTTQAAVIEAGLTIVNVIAIAGILLSFAFVLFNAVSGTGNTRFTLIAELCIITQYVLFAYIFIRLPNPTVARVWTVEIFYAAFMIIISAVYLFSGRWKRREYIVRS